MVFLSSLHINATTNFRRWPSIQFEHVSLAQAVLVASLPLPMTGRKQPARSVIVKKVMLSLHGQLQQLSYKPACCAPTADSEAVVEAGPCEHRQRPMETAGTSRRSGQRGGVVLTADRRTMAGQRGVRADECICTMTEPPRRCCAQTRHARRCGEGGGRAAGVLQVAAQGSPALRRGSGAGVDRRVGRGVLALRGGTRYNYAAWRP